MLKTSEKENQEPKHPRHMTTEEAITHLFHSKVIEHIKNQQNEPKRRPRKEG